MNSGGWRYWQKEFELKSNRFGVIMTKQDLTLIERGSYEYLSAE